uniref:Uncharacterized protein n=1 Tax=Panagrellus redivivus TaxID=6233 RepID=A0A7E4VGY5_PANRE
MQQYVLLIAAAFIFVVASESVQNSPVDFRPYRRFNDLESQFEENLLAPLVKRPFERRDGAVIGARRPSFVKSGIVRDIVNDEAGKSSSRFARKNCFFSPVQCSFYYKRSVNLF